MAVSLVSIEDFQTGLSWARVATGPSRLGWPNQARLGLGCCDPREIIERQCQCVWWRGEAPNNVVAKNEEERNNNNNTSSNNNSNTHNSSSKQKKSISRDREDEVHKVIAGGFFLLVLKFLQSLGTITRFME